MSTQSWGASANILIPTPSSNMSCINMLLFLYFINLISRCMNRYRRRSTSFLLVYVPTCISVAFHSPSHHPLSLRDIRQQDVPGRNTVPKDEIVLQEQTLGPMTLRLPMSPSDRQHMRAMVLLASALGRCM